MSDVQSLFFNSLYIFDYIYGYILTRLKFLINTGLVEYEENPLEHFLNFFRVKRAIKAVKGTLEWKVQKGMQQESLHLAIARYRWDIPLTILQYNDTWYKGAIGSYTR